MQNVEISSATHNYVIIVVLFLMTVFLLLCFLLLCDYCVSFYYFEGIYCKCILFPLFASVLHFILTCYVYFQMSSGLQNVNGIF
jgi:hypothetical protein